MPVLDFFQCLETTLEPVFDTTAYSQIPQNILAILNTNNLFKDTYLTEIGCDKCGDDCPENNILTIKHDQHCNKYYYTCPTGYLKNPVWLPDESVKGKQFDFNRLKQLITKELNLATDYTDYSDNNFYPLGIGTVGGQKVLAGYLTGLNTDNLENKILSIRKNIADYPILVFSPSFEVVKTDDIQLLEDNHIISVTVRELLEKDFDVMKAIKQKLVESLPDNQFIKHSDAWLISFAGKTIPVKNSRGMPYIQYLLTNRHKKITSLELQKAIYPPPPGKSDALYRKFGEDSSTEESDFLNKVSSKDFRELEDLQEQIEEAERNEDTQVSILREKRDKILGRYQQDKKKPDTYFVSILKKLQKNISTAIDRAIDDIKESHPELASHLKAFIIRSRGFTYQPDSEIDWQTNL
ncbi:MAG: hypothetical protein V1871_06785 [Planctomycetota bacterium]